MQMIPEVVVKSALLRFQLDGGTKEGNCVLTPPLPWGRTIYQRHGARKWSYSTRKIKNASDNSRAKYYSLDMVRASWWRMHPLRWPRPIKQQYRERTSNYHTHTHLVHLVCPAAIWLP